MALALIAEKAKYQEVQLCEYALLNTKKCSNCTWSTYTFLFPQLSWNFLYFSKNPRVAFQVVYASSLQFNYCAEFLVGYFINA